MMQIHLKNTDFFIITINMVKLITFDVKLKTQMGKIDCNEYTPDNCIHPCDQTLDPMSKKQNTLDI